MRSALLCGAFAFALAGVFGISASQFRAAVQETDATVGVAIQQAALHDDFDEDTTGSIGGAPGARLVLDDEQRGFIFLGIINVPDVAEQDIAPPRLAERLPMDVPVQNIPAMVLRKIPQAEGHGFVKLDDRILLVSAESREVVAAIPRYKLIVR